MTIHIRRCRKTLLFNGFKNLTTFSNQNTDVQTEPPPRSNFADTVNQWVIYDAYVSYEFAKELQDEKDRARSKKDDSNQTIKRLLGTKGQVAWDKILNSVTYVSFVSFFVFGFWSLLATNIQNYKNISNLCLYFAK